MSPMGENTHQLTWGGNIKIHLAIFSLRLIGQLSQKWFLILAGKPFRGNQRSGIPSKRFYALFYPWASGIQLASTAFQEEMLVCFSSAGEKLRIDDIWLFRCCSWSDNIHSWMRLSFQSKSWAQITWIGRAMWYGSENAKSFPKVEMASVR